MRHFKVINDNSSLEDVSINLLNTLYNIVHNNTLDNASNLKGNVSVSYYYEEYINEIRTKYLLFTVNTLDYYVLFADANAAKKSISDWGDGIGVVANNVTDTYLYETFSKDKMIDYYGDDDANWKITSYNELSKFSTIIKLDTSAFNSQSYLTSVNLKNIKQLGSYNFYNCMSLTSLGDTSSIVSITGKYNFTNCTSLTSVDFPSLTGTLGDNSFEGCSSLQTVNMPNVTTIGAYAFRNCTSLTSISLDNVTQLNAYAFSGCASFTELPSNFKNLLGMERDAFNGCINLIKADLSQSKLVHGGNNTFRFCTALKEIRYPKTVTTLYESWCPTNDTIKVVGLENVTAHTPNNWQIQAKNSLYPIALKNITTHQTILECNRNNSKSGHSLFLPKVLESNDASGSIYDIVPASSAFQYACHQGGRLRLKLLYYRDIQTFGYAHFLNVLIDNLVINNVTPPQYRTTEVAVDYFPEWQALNGDGSRCQIGTLWVPDSAVSTYQANPIYADLNIKGIDSQTNGQYNLPRWATFEDWEEEALANEAQNLDYPVGLIEEWM